MAANNFYSTAIRIGPRIRISRRSVGFNRQLVFREFVRRRLLSPLNVLPPRQPPRVVDARIGVRGKGISVGFGLAETAPAQISTATTGTADSQIPESSIPTSPHIDRNHHLDINRFLTVDLSQYEPSKSTVKGSEGTVNWFPAANGNGQVLSPKEHGILTRLATAIARADGHPGVFTKQLFRWLKQVQAHPTVAQYLT